MVHFGQAYGKNPCQARDTLNTERCVLYTLAVCALTQAACIAICTLKAQQES